MATVVSYGLACADCAVIIANDDWSGVSDPEHHARSIRRVNLSQNGRFQVVNACPENCEGEYSTYPCDYCGSTLDGERHPIAVLESRANSRPGVIGQKSAAQGWRTNG